MSDRDLPNMDDVELPDVPDDDELDSEETEDAGGEGGSTEDSGGGGFGALLSRLGPIAAVLAPVGRIVAPLGALLAPVVAILASLFGKVAAPLGAAAAKVGPPIAKVAAPIGAIAGPLIARVPRPIQAGLGSFAGIVVLFLVLSAVLSGSRGGAEASAAATKAAAVKSSAPLAAPTKPKPAYTATPALPTPSPTPAVFAPLGKGYLVTGNVLPNPHHKLIPDRMLWLDDDRASYRLAVNFAVLLRSGVNAPFWGVVLGFEDELNHLRLEFYSDTYDQTRPYAALQITKNGQSKRIGPPSRVLNGEHWGRDTHELIVDVHQPEIVATLDGGLLGQWKYQDTIQPLKKGLYLWGPSRMRFDSVRIE